MKRRSALALPFGLLAEGCSLAPPEDLDAPETPWPVPAHYPQHFRTYGNTIIDGAGLPRIFRGVAAPDVLWLSQRQDEKLGRFNRDLFRAAAEWRADLVRISIMPAVLRFQGEAVMFRVLDAAVAYARRYGLYLVLCFHSIGFPPDGRYTDLRDPFYGDLYATSGAEMYRFWQAVARRYAGNPVVAFYELFNEPTTVNLDRTPSNEPGIAPWLRWRDFTESLVDAIRLVDFRKPIIVGGLQYGYDLSFAPQAPVRRDNIVYATHPYANSDWRIGWEEAFLAPARQLPVIATEFGWHETDHPESAYRGAGRYREAIFQAFDRARIGWLAWCFSHSFTPALLQDARSYRPTEYGLVVLNALRERAPPLPPVQPRFVT
ncbi:cellulase family glycosylhydrolase [Belnapia sp. T6]|uniref:Cellulase family glycosylhydrolase n=1 Tax=Belnapia mucosa TaxID=2804532 RepID=A0ABS1V024_9PROT|nr:cellulase family glycosylhydrolase [Belnapia mucosa]MBL6454431.1 cellulase family glycosylhydrolase [Belnapia mucosa]